MKPAAQWKRPFLIACAGAVVLAIGLQASGGNGDAEVVQPRLRDAPAAPGATGGGAAARGGEGTERGLEPPDPPARARLAQGASTDPFAPRSFAPPIPKPLPVIVVPPPPPPPPPPPTAPPVPYKFIGQIEERSTKPAAFLTKNGALFVVHAGEVLENTYRIESFNAAQVVLTYLPLQQRQTLEVSGGS